MALVPSGITKVDRSQWLVYLDTTPTEGTPNWAVLGVGITEFAIAYNPQVDTEKWIIEDNARNDHTSNQKQGSVSQKIYKGDPCFEFVHKGCDKLNYATKILEVDRWNGTGSKYPAKMTDGMITITQKGGDNAVLEYDLYFNGEPVEGEVTFAGDVPTFAPKSEA